MMESMYGRQRFSLLFQALVCTLASGEIVANHSEMGGHQLPKFGKEKNGKNLRQELFEYWRGMPEISSP